MNRSWILLATGAPMRVTMSAGRELKGRVLVQNEEVAERTAIFIFEGPNDVSVCESLEAAEGWVEAVDVARDLFEFFADDETVITATTQGHRVFLQATSMNRSTELRQRLRTYLIHPAVALDPRLADDPSALARLLLERQQSMLWPRRPRWLHRLVHR